MSKTLFSFMLNELKSLRIVCQRCGTAVDIPIDKVANAKEVFCPGCPDTGKTVLNPAAGSTVLVLANAILRAQEMKDVAIEFEIDRPSA